MVVGSTKGRGSRTGQLCNLVNGAEPQWSRDFLFQVSVMSNSVVQKASQNKEGKVQMLPKGNAAHSNV